MKQTERGNSFHMHCDGPLFAIELRNESIAVFFFSVDYLGEAMRFERYSRKIKINLQAK